MRRCSTWEKALGVAAASLRLEPHARDEAALADRRRRCLEPEGELVFVCDPISVLQEPVLPVPPGVDYEVAHARALQAVGDGLHRALGHCAPVRAPFVEHHRDIGFIGGLGVQGPALYLDKALGALVDTAGGRGEQRRGGDKDFVGGQRLAPMA